VNAGENSRDVFGALLDGILQRVEPFRQVIGTPDCP
jgi:hypothetical protein